MNQSRSIIDFIKDESNAEDGLVIIIRRHIGEKEVLRRVRTITGIS